MSKELGLAPTGVVSVGTLSSKCWSASILEPKDGSVKLDMRFPPKYLPHRIKLCH